MNQLRLFVRGSRQLHVKIIDGNGWNLAASPTEVLLIASVIELFLNEFNPEFLFSGSIEVANDPAADAPVILFGMDARHRRINLNLTTSYDPPLTILNWPQMAFQLAHELAHYFSCVNSCHADDWFMETIAEVASLFFLKKMDDVFSQHPLDRFRGCSFLFRSYLDARLQSVPCIDRNCSQAWYQQNFQALNRSKTERRLNLQAAKMLLPLVESLPGAWNALLFAPPAGGDPLSVFLAKWIARCPEGSCPCRRLLEECRTMFPGTAESAK